MGVFVWLINVPRKDIALYLIVTMLSRAYSGGADVATPPQSDIFSCDGQAVGRARIEWTPNWEA